MTVADTATQITYLGNGATTEFNYPFEIIEESDLQVVLKVKSSLAETVLTLDVDYSVDVNTSEVTYPLIGSPMASTHFLVIRRVLAFAQETSYDTQGNFSPSTLESALDYITMLTQDLRNLLRMQANGLSLPTYTVATVPSVINSAPSLIYVRDASGGGIPCFTDGTNWRRVDTRGIVS